jgi:hypothetical protein
VGRKARGAYRGPLSEAVHGPRAPLMLVTSTRATTRTSIRRPASKSA